VYEKEKKMGKGGKFVRRNIDKEKIGGGGRKSNRAKGMWGLKSQYWPFRSERENIIFTKEGRGFRTIRWTLFSRLPCCQDLEEDWAEEERGEAEMVALDIEQDPEEGASLSCYEALDWEENRAVSQSQGI
jgi:hypothetical protein